MSEYKTLAAEAVGEITEKKSRFIATLRPVASEEEALAFIAAMKKKYWDARHNCSAYIISPDAQADSSSGTVTTGPDGTAVLPPPLERCSDDGEPSRTAGMPMLEVLKGAGLQNVCCVVTRYFGGILLGTGGLVRAYQGAVQEGLANSSVITRKHLNRVLITVDYTSYGKLQYIAEQNSFRIENTDFGGDVTVTFLLDDAQLESLTEQVTEATSGGCLIDNEGKTWCFV